MRRSSPKRRRHCSASASPPGPTLPWRCRRGAPPDPCTRAFAACRRESPAATGACVASLSTSSAPPPLTPGTVSYILPDEVVQGPVSDRAVTLGIGTIRGAREVVVLVSGSAKRAPLARLLDGAVDPAVPASALRLHPRCTILADAEAHP